MKNKVKEIMDNYKKEVKKLDEKYEVPPVKKPNTKELENKIQYEKDFIAKLEFEGAEINSNLIENSKQRLDKAIKEKEEIDSKYQEELLKREEKLQNKKALKNSTVVLESGREVKMSEKDKMDKADLKDRAIRDLTKESQEISKQLLNKSKELESKRREWQEFKYEYEKDENGKINPEPINKAEVSKIHAEFDNITKEMTELDNMQKECNKYLEELKTPSKEDKNFMEAWKKAAKVERGQNPADKTQTDPKTDSEKTELGKTDSGKTEPGKTEPEKTEPGKTDSGKTEPGKTEPGKTEPAKTEPGKTEPGKTEPGKTEPGKTEPGKTEPGKTEPGKTEPGKTEQGKTDPAKTDSAKTKPTSQNIYSNSFIHINCSKGEAEVYLSSVDGKQVIGNISDIIENRKSKFERLDVNGMLEKFGVESRIKKFMMRRKINPIILEAIQEDEKLTDKYIESVVNNEEFPFNYKLDLENSILPSKETNFMNRLAFKESKIEGNEIIGAEKLHAIKNIFRSIKNKGQRKFKKQENQKKLPVAKEKTTQKNRLGDELKRQLEEQNKRYDEAYNRLSPEQQENLKEMSVSDLQRLGIDYTTACGVLDKYKTSENERKSKNGEKEKTEGTQEKQSEQKEGDEQTV